MEIEIYDYVANEFMSEEFVREIKLEKESKYELINGKIHGTMPYEIIGGEKVMSPAANAMHGSLVMRLGFIFSEYVEKKHLKVQVFGDNVDVYLAREAHYRPDVSVICNLDIINWKGAVMGSPDLVIEVFSKRTKDRDVGVKKDDYEKYGVREYWLVDPIEKSITVYHLVDGKFKLNGEYKAHALNNKNEIKVSIFDDLIVDVRDVFKYFID